MQAWGLEKLLVDTWVERKTVRSGVFLELNFRDIISLKA